ncbi:hypothetical protein [Aliiglaciecola sp. LCG003]|uniref:hypothetical protein n=1 Tax=Aliiglaciecola sp. LCG003 TaxID=3053655 RepID=UPI002573C126|nr:hypothetical protein [Aliiglaciecola sp. LCG003]WJG10690.1 hypothetical protein QR722_06515 [Aliiglaciecola sp. LCG003]
MNKQQLMSKIEELRQAAESLEGATKAFKLNEISILKIKIEGMAIQDIAAKMNSITLPELADMDVAIESAANAVKTQQQRVQAFDKAYTFIKTALGLVI